MAFTVEPSWLGRRVSVRRVVDRDEDGRLLFGDVVGELAGLDAQTAVVDGRHGLVEIPLALVAAARIVMPSTADELALERIAGAGWRAEHTDDLDGWLLRADDGGTRRANSVAPLAQLHRPLGEALDRVREWYAAQGSPALIQVPLDARRLLDAELGERGWSAEGRTQVLVRSLPSSVTTDVPAQVELAGRPDPAWRARYGDGTGTPAALAQLLGRHDDVIFAAVRVDGDVVAIARGCVDDGWLGITAVAVDPAHRRTGLARRVVTGLWAWGVDRGARHGYVQVAGDNSAAIALYEQLGYWRHHDYHYRREPGPDAVDHARPGSVPAPYA